MRCPKCGNDDDKVLDSRTSKEGAAIRRRRECLKCGFRFTTHEEIDREELFVIKRGDQRREPFQRAKLEKSIRIACQKRPIPESKVRDLIDSIVASFDGFEVQSSEIGERVMKELHEIDEIAYIRFASVYRRFTDVNQFLSTITEMVQKK